MKFAEIEIINLKADVITASGGCRCYNPSIPGSEDCPTDE